MLPSIIYRHILHFDDMAFVQDTMTQYPVISLVIASLLCFGLVLFVSNLTISSTGKQKQAKGASKSKSKKTSKGKTPTRRAKSPAGARRSTRKRTAVKAHNVSDVSGQSY